jgi:hypothetical protein
MKPTYDEKQIGAVLTYCMVCHRHYFATKPQAVCVLCRRERLKGERGDPVLREGQGDD